MGLISWIVVGVIAALLAGWITAGSEPSSFVLTILLGIAGACVGGFIVGILTGSGVTGFNAWSVLVATLGAIVLFLLYGLVVRRAT